MARPHPMHRLLQGDVGAGKTIVALLAAVVAMENGLQVAFMAPTEILAEQHYLTIRRLLRGGALTASALLTGSTPAPSAGAVLGRRSQSGHVHLVVGTHALVQETVTFARSAWSSIDEQHRFGVMQRAAAAREGLEPGRAGDDRDADPADARADASTATSTCR